MRKCPRRVHFGNVSLKRGEESWKFQIFAPHFTLCLINFVILWLFKHSKGEISITSLFLLPITKMRS